MTQVERECVGDTPREFSSHGRMSIKTGNSTKWVWVAEVLQAHRRREASIYFRFGQALHCLAHLSAERMSKDELLDCCQDDDTAEVDDEDGEIG